MLAKDRRSEWFPQGTALAPVLLAAGFLIASFLTPDLTRNDSERFEDLRMKLQESSSSRPWHSRVLSDLMTHVLRKEARRLSWLTGQPHQARAIRAGVDLGDVVTVDALPGGLSADR
jgi:hypothetical protein